ncbi:hypothetical protein LCE31_36055, partial [Streptomyces sp. 8L]|nr:hypothetical protein [Streptomyces sp. 8L]
RGGAGAPRGAPPRGGPPAAGGGGPAPAPPGAPPGLVAATDWYKDTPRPDDGAPGLYVGVARVP